MPKIFKVLLFFVLLPALSLYILYAIYNYHRYAYSFGDSDFKEYLWLFKDSFINEIDTVGYSESLRQSDVIFYYHYKKEYVINIWEFKDLGGINLRKIAINKNVNLSDINFAFTEIISAKSDQPISVNQAPLMKNSFNVNIDEQSSIDSSFESINYKGFYGTINKMSFSDDKGEHYCVLDFLSDRKKELFLLYKGKHSLFAITIDSRKLDGYNVNSIFNLQ